MLCALITDLCERGPMKHNHLYAPRPPVRVVIADDIELIRIGLQVVIESEPDLSIMGAAADGREAVELCNRLRPELAILDERMPVLDGLEAARLIKQYDQSIRVIILSPQGDPLDRARALRVGVEGYLLKTVQRGDLVVAIRRVLQGQTLWRSADDVALAAWAGAAAGTPEHLTPRELDVLRLLARGKTNAVIAADLSLSRGTVKAYVEQIIAKLQVTGRTHATMRAVELGLLQIGDK